MRSTRFVPPVQQEFAQYPSLSKALTEARDRLSSALAEGDPGKATDAWNDHDRIVTEAELVRRSMDKVISEGGAAVSAACENISQHIARGLIDEKSELHATIRTCALTEHAMTELYLALSRGYTIDNSVRTNAKSIVHAYDELGRVFRLFGKAMRDQLLLENGHSLAKAWAEHGFSSLTMLVTHRRGQIPDSMRHFMTSKTVSEIDPTASVLDENAWRDFNETVLGRKMGFLARYACRDCEQLDALMMLEQLSVPRRSSILTPDIYDSLIRSVQTMPTAGLPRDPDASIPMMFIMLSRRDYDTGWTDFVKRVVEKYDTHELVRAMCAHTAEFAIQGVCTEEEMQSGHVPCISKFLSLPYVLFALVAQLYEDPRKSVRDDRALDEQQRSLVALVIILWDLRNDHCKALLSRILFWWRYAQRPLTVESASFWKWNFRQARFLMDLKAFVGASSWMSSASWTFDPYAAVYDK